MINKYVISQIAIAAGVSLLTASMASAESQAGFEAGSLAGSMYDTQSNSQNNSQASSTNSSQSVNEQASHAATQNTSQGSSEEVGGPLTRIRPGYIGSDSSTNTRNSMGNTAGMTGSPSMTLPLNNTGNKNGGTGYFSPANRGAIAPRNPGDTSASNPLNGNAGTLIPPPGKSASTTSVNNAVHTTTNIQRIPEHIPVAVVKSYKWSRTKRYNRYQTRTIGSRYSRSARIQ